MRNRPVLQMVVIVVIGSAILIPLTLIVPWFPAKGSIQAAHVHTLYDVLLVATVHGLRASLLHQPMEWPDLRRSLSPTPGHNGHAQMLIRLGYGPDGPATPRQFAH